jgi:DNA-binding LytR/AlgR family response regulator
MKILLIEDNQNKVNQLRTFINLEFPDVELIIKGSYHSGLKEIILNDSYKLILLDISMPTYDIKPGESGGDPIPLAGKLILKEMYLRDIETKVVVVTMYENFVDGTRLDELNEQFKQEFTTNYSGFVYFSPADSNWKEILKSKIVELL